MKTKTRLSITSFICMTLCLGIISFKEPTTVHAASTNEFLSEVEVNATVDTTTSYAETYDQNFYNEINSKYDTDYTNENTALTISTATQLAAFAKVVNEGKGFDGKYVKLNNDIDLQGTMPNITKTDLANNEYKMTINNPNNAQQGLKNVWNPIGYDREDVSVKSFNGTFDGNHHTVNNIVVLLSSSKNIIRSQYYAGFFGKTQNATIKNLGMKDGIVISDMISNGEMYTKSDGGALVGSVYAGTIKNCYADSVKIFVLNESEVMNVIYSYGGGLAGIVQQYSTIENCYATGEIVALCRPLKNISSCSYGGGLVGYVSQNSTIKNCYATGNATATALSSYFTTESSSGGLVGKALGNIKDCYATGKAVAYSHNNSYGGGLIGFTGLDAKENCYAIGDVIVSGSDDSYGGGLIGKSVSVDIKNCYRNADAKIVASKVSDEGKPLYPQHMTGTGSARASEVMEGFDKSNWIFAADGQLNKNGNIRSQTLYYPRLNNQKDGLNMYPNHNYPKYEGTHSYNVEVELPLDSNMTLQSQVDAVFINNVYVADKGYYFPEDYKVASENGIHIKRDSYNQISVFGIPTHDTKIDLISTTKKTEQTAPTSLSSGVNKIIGTTTDMEYASAPDEKTWISCSDGETNVQPGHWYVRYKEKDTENASESVKITTICTVKIVNPADSGITISKQANNGTENQSVRYDGSMNSVTYIADKGYYFPEDYQMSSVNGVQVERNSLTQITVSGKPTAIVELNLTPATKKTEQIVPTTLSGGVNKIIGTTTDMEYASAPDEKTWISCSDGETNVQPGHWYVRYKETDTEKAGASVKVSTIYTVKVINPDGTHITLSNGIEMQNVSFDKDIVSIVYTAEKGYYFPEDYQIDSKTGIYVKRDSNNQISVFGRPIANTEIILKSATKAIELDSHISMTGDETSINIWIIFMVVSVILMGVILIVRKNIDKENS